MNWEKGVQVIKDGVGYNLSVAVSKYADDWVFAIDDKRQNGDKKRLLPHTVYLHFDKDKKYKYSFPADIVADDVIHILVDELKRYQLNWFRGWSIDTSY